MVTIGDRQDVVNRSIGVERHGESGPGHAEAGPAKLGVSIESLSDAPQRSAGLQRKGRRFGCGGGAWIFSPPILAWRNTILSSPSIASPSSTQRMSPESGLR